MIDSDRQQSRESGADRERDTDRDGPFGGISFELPPITFPPFFPEDFAIRIPIPQSVRTAGSPLLAAIAIDGIDAITIVAIGSAGGWLRVLLGTGLMALLFGPFGLAYGLEAVPIIVGRSTIGLAPTATVVALMRRLR